MTTRYLSYCALSGCFWAAVAYAMGHRWMGHVIWGGLMASPLIGVAVGVLYYPAYRLHILARVLLALLTLYAGATLFGLASGLYDATRDVPQRDFEELIAQAVLATLWGVTLTGYVVFLWPLAYLNHWLIGRCSSLVGRQAPCA